MSQYPTTIFTADGVAKLELAPGEYAIQASGSFGSGTLTILWDNGTNDAVAYPDAALTTAGGVVIAVGMARVILVLSGATSPSIEVSAAKIS